MNKDFNIFVYSTLDILIKLVYGATDVAVMNNGRSVVFTVNGIVKYATIQIFEYDDYLFTYNKETFDGEKGVIQFSPLYVRMFDTDKIKGLLINNKHNIKKNSYGDMTIPIEFIKNEIVEIKTKNDKRRIRSNDVRKQSHDAKMVKK